MADIIEIPFALDSTELVSGLASDMHISEPRSPGAHLSDIIRDLENTVLKPGQRKSDSELSADEIATLNNYREMGFIWEVAMEMIFKQRRIDKLDGGKFIRQMEVEKDEIFLTTDAVHIRDWRIIEYKLTYRSANRAQLDRIEVEFWSWFTQLKAHCYVHGSRLAALLVMFVCGTYNPPIPTPKGYLITFEDQELIDNWNMLLKHKAVMEREGRASWLKQTQ